MEVLQGNVRSLLQGQEARTPGRGREPGCVCLTWAYQTDVFLPEQSRIIRLELTWTLCFLGTCVDKVEQLTAIFITVTCCWCRKGTKRQQKRQVRGDMKTKQPRDSWTPDRIITHLWHQTSNFLPNLKHCYRPNPCKTKNIKCSDREHKEIQYQASNKPRYLTWKKQHQTPVSF